MMLFQITRKKSTQLPDKSAAKAEVKIKNLNRRKEIAKIYDGIIERWRENDTISNQS